MVTHNLGVSWEEVADLPPMTDVAGISVAEDGEVFLLGENNVAAEDSNIGIVLSSRRPSEAAWTTWVRATSREDSELSPSAMILTADGRPVIGGTRRCGAMLSAVVAGPLLRPPVLTFRREILC